MHAYGSVDTLSSAVLLMIADDGDGMAMASCNSWQKLGGGMSKHSTLFQVLTLSHRLPVQAEAQLLRGDVQAKTLEADRNAVALSETRRVLSAVTAKVQDQEKKLAEAQHDASCRATQVMLSHPAFVYIEHYVFD